MLAGAVSVGFLSFGLPSPIFGVLIARYGPRSNIIAGNLLAAVGVAGMFFVQEVWHVYCLYVLIGLGGGFGGYIAGTTIVNNWFVKKRSLALGMFMACGGLGGLVFPPFITVLISSMGWRNTWLTLAGIFVVVVLIGGIFLIRNRPEDVGLTPDGLPESPATVKPDMKEDSEPLSRQTGWLKKTVGMPVTWFIIAMVTAGAFSMGTISTHQIAFIQDFGYSAITAATVASVMAVSQTCGSLIMGAMGLRFNVRFLAAIAFVFQIIGIIIILSTRTLSIIYLYAACMGISWGAVLTALPTFIGTNYPRNRYAQVMGIVFPFQVLSQAVSATIAGIVYDNTGQYTTMFFVLICFCVIGFASALMARSRRPWV